MQISSHKTKIHRSRNRKERNKGRIGGRGCRRSRRRIRGSHFITKDEKLPGENHACTRLERFNLAIQAPTLLKGLLLTTANLHPLRIETTFLLKYFAKNRLAIPKQIAKIASSIYQQTILTRETTVGIDLTIPKAQSFASRAIRRHHDPKQGNGRGKKVTTFGRRSFRFLLHFVKRHSHREKDHTH